MGERKELGRIAKATFGFGGYQDAQLGLSLTFEGKGWGVCHFVGTWAERAEHARYSQAEHDEAHLGTVNTLRDTLRAAKKEHVAQLAGTPVELTLDGNLLKDWRVLTEVL